MVAPSETLGPDITDVGYWKNRLPALPGFHGLPSRLVERVLPKSMRRPSVLRILILFAGLANSTCLQQAFWLHAPELACHTVEMDIIRNGDPFQDFLDDENFGELCWIAACGNLMGLTGGPTVEAGPSFVISPGQVSPES